MIFAGAVLAGGASRRMGRPKPFIELDGLSMVRRVADALRAAGANPVMAVGGDAVRIRAVGLAPVDDLHPGEGPLGGIITALHSCGRADAVAVLACDLVTPSPDAIGRLAAALPGHDAVVPVVGGRRQWTHAVWACGVLATLEVAFAAGERAPRRAVAGLDIVAFDDPDPSAYVDADSPADLPPGTT